MEKRRATPFCQDLLDEENGTSNCTLSNPTSDILCLANFGTLSEDLQPQQTQSAFLEPLERRTLFFFGWPWICCMPQHALSHEFPWRPCSKLTMVFACKSAVPGRWLAFWMPTSCQSEAGYILVYWLFLIVSLKFRTFLLNLAQIFLCFCWKIGTWDS